MQPTASDVTQGMGYVIFAYDVGLSIDLEACTQRITTMAQRARISSKLFDGVNDALKLIGDQYLARVYRLASQRFRLEEWDASILRKLHTLDSIYHKISDQATSRRMEVLEWIIIVLIAVSIVLPFFTKLPWH